MGVLFGGLQGARRSVRLGVACVLLGLVLAAPAGAAARSWSHGPPVFHGAYAVSCVSRSFCAAVGLTGRAATFDGHRWSATVNLNHGNPLYAISCVRGPFCIVAGSGAPMISGGGASDFEFTGGRWRSVPFPLLDAVSCGSRTFCVGTTGDLKPTVRAFDGSTWGAAIDAFGGADVFGGANEVSCPSASFCMLMGLKDAVSFVGGAAATPVRVEPLQASSTLEAISCASTSACVAVDKKGRALTFDRGAWGGSVQVAPANRPGKAMSDVSCSGRSLCAASANAGVFVLTGRSWSRATRIPRNTVVGVSCASASFCIALGEQTQTYVYR